MRDRIQQILIAKGKSSSQFANNIGVQASSVSHVLSGRNKPSLDFILKILQNYSDIDPEWLLFGKGEMNSEKAPITSSIDNSAKTKVIPDVISDVNLFDTKSTDNNINENNTREAEVLSAKKSSEVSVKDLTRIVFFYSDGSFTEYIPE